MVVPVLIVVAIVVVVVSTTHWFTTQQSLRRLEAQRDADKVLRDDMNDKLIRLAVHQKRAEETLRDRVAILERQLKSATRQ